MPNKCAPEKIQLQPFHLLDQDWALLVAGKEKPNPMTVSWGGFGTLWHKPSVIVYVRPTRYTFDLLEKHAEFTLNFLPQNYRDNLEICGTTSGRDTDKWKDTGLTPEPSETVLVPRVKEALLTFECRVLAYQDFDPQRFCDPEIETNYALKDYHRIFWGEPLCIWSEKHFVKNPAKTGS